ncbi:MAG TPA: outer membrane protein transport protein [Burkholderiaceae bacterium]|nr:outer membrane protein transport protein [Burkholderiaceae bacterium]
MDKRLRGGLMAALTTAAALPGLAGATDGYFPHGYGLKGKGMGGTSIALAQDAMGGANNPAAMAFAGDRFDIGLDWFSPHRSAERDGAPVPSLNGRVDSDSTNFLVPELGFNKMLNPDLALGVTVYGNGGMNTDYPQGNFNCGAGAANILCGSGRLGVDLMQLVVAPTAAYKLAPEHSIGIAPLFGYQRFKIEGLQAFDGPASSSPGNVTNRGYDSSTGFGVRIGYQGQTGPFSFGAAYASRMHMSEFKKYSGLFAENGDFDIPSHYGVGVAWRSAALVTLAFDYMRINYSEVASVGNPSTNISQAPLGASNGPGFGWKDINVYKFGVAWQATPALVMRAGYNHSDNPITPRDVTFNILAPGVIQNHYTLGMTYSWNPGSELTFAYMHAQTNSVTGPSLIAGTETIRMFENSFGMAYGLRF